MFSPPGSVFMRSEVIFCEDLVVFLNTDERCMKFVELMRIYTSRLSNLKMT